MGGSHGHDLLLKEDSTEAHQLGHVSSGGLQLAAETVENAHATSRHQETCLATRGTHQEVEMQGTVDGGKLKEGFSEEVTFHQTPPSVGPVLPSREKTATRR